MAISLDHLGRLLLSAPFPILSVALAVNMLREARHAWTVGEKIKIVLTALAIASPGVGVTVMIFTEDDLVWCTEAKQDDPRCKLRGGE